MSERERERERESERARGRERERENERASERAGERDSSHVSLPLASGCKSEPAYYAAYQDAAGEREN